MPQPDPNPSALSPADRQQIEREHQRLAMFLHDLHDTCCKFQTLDDCQGCGREKIACCQGRLASFRFDFFDLVAEHIENEEQIMRNSLGEAGCDEFLRSHQDEHIRLMREMNDWMREMAALNKEGHTAAAIRKLHRQISARFGEHAEFFDHPFLELVQGPALRRAAG
jgi:hypothetical protein